MEQGKIRGGLTTQGKTTSLTLQWEPPLAGAYEPPAAYYLAVRPSVVGCKHPGLDPSADRGLPCGITVGGATQAAPRSLAIELGGLTDALKDGAIHVTVELDFPDTRHYATCSHPGMEDVYYVVVELDVDVTGTLTASKVSPMNAMLGPI